MTLKASIAFSPIDRTVVGLITLLLPLRAVLPIASSSLSVGILLMVPFWVVAFARATKFRFSALLITLYLATFTSGVALLTISGWDHVVDTTTGWAIIITSFGQFLTVVGILWARTWLTTRTVAILFSVGMIIQATLTPDQWSTNAWKFAFAFPVSTLLLALVYNSRRRWPTITVLTTIAILAIINGERSYIGFMLVVGLFFFWRSSMRRAHATGLQTAAAAAGSLAVAAAIYQAGIWAALQGFLGERNQEVTAEQIQQSGSVILSARSESGAAIQLFALRPFGFGPGVQPNLNELATGQSGLVSSGVDLDGTYVKDYLFGDGIKLHSVISDMWVNFGFAGLALSILFGIILVYTLASYFRAGNARGLSLFLITIALWDLLFSPAGTNLIDVTFAVGLLAPFKSAFGLTEERPPEPLAVRPRPPKTPETVSREGQIDWYPVDSDRPRDIRQ